VTIAWSLASAPLQFIDCVAFRELIRGLTDLLPATRPLAAVNFAKGFDGAGFFAYFFSLLLLSELVVLSSFRLRGAGKVIVTVQLIVMSVAFDWLLWQLSALAGRPVSVAIGLLIASIVGTYLKLREDERRVLEAKQVELKLRNRELQDSRLAMVRQDEAERRLLAADLHDQILNDLRTVMKKFEQYVAAPNDGVAEVISSQLKQTMNDVREIMDDLCPVMLEEFGLAAAIEDRLDKAAKTFALKVRFNSSVDEIDLSRFSPVEIQLLYRLVQEAITNACKHSKGSLLRVSMLREDEQIKVSISDNGVGIDPSTLSETSRGTMYMRLRSALIGATISWKPGKDEKGTTVEIRVNLPEMQNLSSVGAAVQDLSSNSVQGASI